MRLNEAATQVGAGVKVEAVALGMGYKSKKNFYRQFKRRFGCTPEVYRRRQDEPAPLAPVDVTARRHTVALQAVPSARRAPDAAGVLVFVARQIRLEAGRLTAVTPAAKQLLVALELAVLVTDAADRCIGANRAAVTITGYSATELSGMPAATLFPDRPPASQRQLLLPLSGAAPLASDVLLHTKRGGVVHVYLARTENLLAAPPADLRGETASVA
jgi:PAS domain S-box-containing protein